MPTIRTALAWLALSGAALIAAAQAPYYVNPMDARILADQASTDNEIKRIEGSDIPSLPELVLDEVRNADSRAQGYAQVAVRRVEVPGFDASKQASLALAAALNKKPCAEPDAANKANQLYAEVSKFYGPISQYQSLSPPDAMSADMAEKSSRGQALGNFLTTVPGGDICGKLAKLQPDELQKMVGGYYDYWAEQFRTMQAQFDQQAPRALKLAEAWKQRKEALTKVVQGQRASSIQSFIAYLPYIVLIFCVFGLSVIAVIRIFPDDVQMEWVASGQVIQFASVMVLLIVVSSLGLLHILEKEGIGTLLGAIGGYVLSQGVGRAAARAAATDKSGKNNKKNEAAAGDGKAGEHHDDDAG